MKVSVMKYVFHFTWDKGACVWIATSDDIPNTKKPGNIKSPGLFYHLYSLYTIPCAFIASATFRNPAMLAPVT